MNLSHWPRPRHIGLVTILVISIARPVSAASCNLFIANLNFGAYVGAQVSGSSAASFTCTKTAPGPGSEKWTTRFRCRRARERTCSDG